MASFIDEAKVYTRAGDGGDGCVSWRREKYVPRGGPAGGDGGNGGDIIFVADSQIRSLLDFKFQQHIRAKSGQTGRSKNQYGAAGDSVVAKVPVGTQVFDHDTGVLICDFLEHGQREVVVKGGSGGFGNTRFQTSTRQAPDFAKPGTPGEERVLKLSLKLLADVGLLGFPNAGKSTFLSSVSAAKPKIADYPFTTLVPQLGVVQTGDNQTFVMADIPGLIEGAAEGAGLGIRFLKHLERVRVICHILEAPSRLTVVDDEDMTNEKLLIDKYEALRGELSTFSSEFEGLPEVVILNKVDLGEEVLSHPAVAAFEKYLDGRGRILHRMSAATGENIEQIKHVLLAKVAPKEEADAAPKYNPFATVINCPRS